jgi:hypothetical protein
MRNTNLETYGNNFPSPKIKRILVPLFTQENPFIQSGLKYFFPENPAIDKGFIVGIEANISDSATIVGDIRDNLNNITKQDIANSLFLVFFDEKNQELFYNIPLRSLFTIDPLSVSPFKLQKRIKPFMGKIKSRSCYAYFPANATIPALKNINISLTFFYN